MTFLLPPAPPRMPQRAPKRSRWIWASVTLLVTSGLVLVGISVAFFMAYANHDIPELIDNPPVANVVDASCATMTSSIKAIPARPTPETIHRQDAAIRQLVASVRTVDAETRADDRPTNAWLADWESLISVREAWSIRLATDPKAKFQIPLVDGRPITERMEYASGCIVPTELLAAGG